MSFPLSISHVVGDHAVFIAVSPGGMVHCAIEPANQHRAVLADICAVIRTAGDIPPDELQALIKACGERRQSAASPVTFEVRLPDELLEELHNHPSRLFSGYVRHDVSALDDATLHLLEMRVLAFVMKHRPGEASR